MNIHTRDRLSRKTLDSRTRVNPRLPGASDSTRARPTSTEIHRAHRRIWLTAGFNLVLGLVLAVATVVVVAVEPGVQVTHELARRTAIFATTWPTLLSAVVVVVVGLQVRVWGLAKESSEESSEPEALGRVRYYMLLAPIVGIGGTAFATIATVAAVVSRTNTHLIAPVWVFALMAVALTADSAFITPAHAAALQEHDREHRLARLCRAREEWPAEVPSVGLRVTQASTVTGLIIASGLASAFLMGMATSTSGSTVIFDIIPRVAVLTFVLVVFNYLFWVLAFISLVDRQPFFLLYQTCMVAFVNLLTGLHLILLVGTPRGRVASAFIGTALIATLSIIGSQFLLRRRWIARAGLLGPGAPSEVTRWLESTIRHLENPKVRNRRRIAVWYDQISGYVAD